MKKHSIALVCMLIAILLAFTVAGCAAKPAAVAEDTPAEAGGPVAPKNGDTYKIGYSHPGVNLALYAQCNKLLLAAAAQLDNVEIIETSADGDSAKQTSDVDTLISQNVDAVIICPNDSTAIGAAVKACNKADIPVALYMRTAAEGKVMTFVGADDYSIGRMAGNYIAARLDGKGKVVNIMGKIGLSTTEGRSEGFKEIINSYPDIEIVAEETGNWAVSDAQNAMDTILQKTKDIQAVWCANDEMASGVIQAIQAAGLVAGTDIANGDILVVGCNFLAANCQLIKDGIQAADVTYPAYMAPRALSYVMDYFAGNEVPATYHMVIDIITKGSVTTFESDAY